MCQEYEVKVQDDSELCGSIMSEFLLIYRIQPTNRQKYLDHNAMTR